MDFFQYYARKHTRKENRKDWKWTSCDYFKLFSFSVATLHYSPAIPESFNHLTDRLYINIQLHQFQQTEPKINNNSNIWIQYKIHKSFYNFSTRRAIGSCINPKRDSGRVVSTLAKRILSHPIRDKRIDLRLQAKAHRAVRNVVCRRKREEGIYVDVNASEPSSLRNHGRRGSPVPLSFSFFFSFFFFQREIASVASARFSRTKSFRSWKRCEVSIGAGPPLGFHSFLFLSFFPFFLFFFFLFVACREFFLSWTSAPTWHSPIHTRVYIIHAHTGGNRNG